MFSVRKTELPGGALLSRYESRQNYTDCFRLVIEDEVALDEFIFAFYTTWLFRIERVLLRFAVSKPSTNDQARRLADGSIEFFAAWSVEDRRSDQLLMRDFHHRTRSWLMVESLPIGHGVGTQLFFGSAVVDAGGSRFSLLLGFHKLYSRALLSAARSRLTSLRRKQHG
ncbi:MAG: hypothetical protein AAF351_15035 [Pseudomonadota bacterium]